MDLSPFGYDRRREAFIILGAGATRGASFVADARVLRPPLDTDFFVQLRASELGHDIDGQRLLDFVEDEFGDLDLSMEAFYSQVYLHDQFVADLPRGKGRRRSYEWAMKRFLRLIPPVFGASIPDENCSWHDALVGALDARDVIASFDYDCVADRSLRDRGRRKWDPEFGYGVQAGGELDLWRDHSGTGRFPRQGLRIYKLHGSLNWRLGADDRLQLLEFPYRRRAQDGELCIVPPLWQKSFDSAPFRDLWLLARSGLTATKALLVIGYSLPQTDVYTQAMLRIDVRDLEFLLIANPDPEARARVKRVLRSAVRATTRVIELESMEEVGKLLPHEADGPVEEVATEGALAAE